MKFENIVLQTVSEKLKLRRMRFKVDPALSNTEDFDGDVSYEGFVLNENEGVLNILVIDPNNGVRQTFAATNSVNILSDNLNQFKRNLVHLLMQKVSEQILLQIQNAPTFDEVEQIAKQNGATDEDIKNAYRKLATDSTVTEANALTRAAGKTLDAVKDVAFGKDAKTLGQKVAGAYGIMGRIGSTLSKFSPKGDAGKFEFSQRSSAIHKDRPRSGQKFNIQDGNNVIDGKISRLKPEVTYGGKTYFQVVDVDVQPPYEDIPEVGKILVEFDINSKISNFSIYDTSNQLRRSIYGALQYDDKLKSWDVPETSGGSQKLSKDKKEKEANQTGYVDQASGDTFNYKGKSYTKVGNVITIGDKKYQPARISGNNTMNPQNIPVG